jgi:hypothetical protein
MNCTKSDREIGKFLSQKSFGEPGKIGQTPKIRPILAVRVNEGLSKVSIIKLDMLTTLILSK